MKLFKNLSLVIWARKCLITAKVIRATDNLIEACRAGNVSQADKAIKQGADPNTMVFIGRFNPGIGHDEEGHSAFVTPLILAATHARNTREKEPYHQIIVSILNHPKLDLDRVAMDEEVEYNRHITYGKTVYKDYKSLSRVLSSSRRNQGSRDGHNIYYSEQNYPISNETAALIRAKLSRQSQKVPFPAQTQGRERS